MASPGIGMPVDAHVVRRVQESGGDRGALAGHRLQELCVAAVAAADPVIAKDPDITGSGARGLRHRRDRLIVGIRRAFQRHVDLAGRETRDRQVEVDVEYRQLAQLQLQKVEIPAGAKGKLVVGKPERPFLRVAQPLEDYAGDLRKRHGPRGKQAVRARQ